MKKTFATIFTAMVMTPYLITAQEVAQQDSLPATEEDQEQNISAFDAAYTEESELDVINQKWKSRRKYKNIGYNIQTLTHQDIPDMKWNSQYALSVNMGRTFYLHKKPLAGMMKFGIDWTYFDYVFAKYKDNQETADEEIDNSNTESNIPGYYPGIFGSSGKDEIDLGVMQMDLGMHLGPSFTINPVGDLMISTYFHFIPSVSFVFLNDEINYNFVPFWSYGGAIAWKAISLGVEYRWGKAKYKSLSMDEEAMDSEEDFDLSNIEDVFKKGNNRLKTGSLRIYLSFRI